MTFLPVDQKQSFPKLEADVLKFWSDHKTFQKSIDARKDKEEYVFYDGPPFATGLPHYGHLLASTIKDVVGRYWTMRGFRVDRTWGWDCHGLPVENLVEKELGLKSKRDIEALGIDVFNEKCRESVLRYTKEWEKTINRMGRWVDFSRAYLTMDANYMESVWWVVKQLHEKGLVYEGYRSMHICPRCGTSLSNFEVTLGYKETQDPAVTVTFPVTKTKGKFVQKGDLMLAWTTTPWTLPGNFLLALHPTLVYIRIKHTSEAGEHYYVLSKAAFARMKELTDSPFASGTTEVVGEGTGADFVSDQISYEPLFSYFKKTKGAFRPVAAEFVTETEGTGIVHIAPGFGEDDLRVGQREKLPIMKHVQMDGTFIPETKEWAGRSALDVNHDIIHALKEQGRVLHHATVQHSYPHCWRCDTKLLNYAMESWFVRVEEIKAKLLENNQKIHWQPEHLKDGRFGKWLENARDWNIGRNRYWGTPIPIWRCEKNKAHLVAVESRAELADLSGTHLEDLHKHHVDGVTFSCKKCTGTMRRIPEVLDCWFESGSMPYAQRHYPFENKEWFEEHFPADFIAEGLDQTRGWFYTLHVLATALFGKPAFKNVVVNGIVLAEDGAKMSKSKKNYPDPSGVFDQFGADAMRFTLMTSSAVMADDHRFSEKNVEMTVKRVLLPLWNAYSFFVTYANIDKWSPNLTERRLSANKLDRWIVSELNVLIQNVTADMDKYNLQALRHIYTFTDSLTNWYIRRSRRRFWRSESNEDKQFAYETLHQVLMTLCQIIAPVMPFVAESMYRNLSSKESVHLTDWPVSDPTQVDAVLNAEIELTHAIANLGHSARSKAKIKVRQPLQSLQIGLPENKRGTLSEDQIEILKDELNVKEIIIVDDPSTIAQIVVKPNARLLGPKYGADVQKIIKEAKAGKFKRLENGSLKVLKYELTPEEVAIEYKGKEGFDIESSEGIVVALDTTLTTELCLEGYAREMIRHIQELRKAAGFNIADRITVYIDTNSPDLRKCITANKDTIADEVLATSLKQEPYAGPHQVTVDIEGFSVTLGVKR